jgi:hypothetical protein
MALQTVFLIIIPLEEEIKQSSSMRKKTKGKRLQGGAQGSGQPLDGSHDY